MLLHRTSSAPQITQQKCISWEPHPWRPSCAVSDSQEATMRCEMFHHGSHLVWLPKHFFLLVSFLACPKSVAWHLRWFCPQEARTSEMFPCFWHHYLNEEVPLFWALSESLKKTKPKNPIIVEGRISLDKGLLLEERVGFTLVVSLLLKKINSCLKTLSWCVCVYACYAKTLQSSLHEIVRYRTPKTSDPMFPFRKIKVQTCYRGFQRVGLEIYILYIVT